MLLRILLLIVNGFEFRREMAKKRKSNYLLFLKKEPLVIVIVLAMKSKTMLGAYTRTIRNG